MILVLAHKSQITYISNVPTANTELPKVPETGTTIKRTSIDIDEDLWIEVKVKAARRKLSTGKAVETAIRYWLSADAPAA